MLTIFCFWDLFWYSSIIAFNLFISFIYCSLFSFKFFISCWYLFISSGSFWFWFFKASFSFFISSILFFSSLIILLSAFIFWFNLDIWFLYKSISCECFSFCSLIWLFNSFIFCSPMFIWLISFSFSLNLLLSFLFMLDICIKSYFLTRSSYLFFSSLYSFLYLSFFGEFISFPFSIKLFFSSIIFI